MTPLLAVLEPHVALVCAGDRDGAFSAAEQAFYPVFLLLL